jgi:cytochrome oxidase assembly protein ShyY1
MAKTTKNIEPKGEVLKKKKVKPIIVETIKSTEKVLKPQVYEKHIMTGTFPVTPGNIRVEVLVDYKGMIDDLYRGDIVDLPERRYKTLVNRGFVKEYKGDRIPNKLR